MIRWRKAAPSGYVENLRVDRFLADIKTVCERHGLCLDLPDHGSLTVKNYMEELVTDLDRATDETDEERIRVLTDDEVRRRSMKVVGV
jgi:hypothetical protein